MLRSRDLEALPNDPQALIAALQAMAGPTDPEEDKRRLKSTDSQTGRCHRRKRFAKFVSTTIRSRPRTSFRDGAASRSSRSRAQTNGTALSLRLQRRKPELAQSVHDHTARRISNAPSSGNLSGPIIKKRASFSVYFSRYLSDAKPIVNATVLDPLTLKPVTVNQSFVTPDVNHYGNARFDLKVNKNAHPCGQVQLTSIDQDLQGVGGISLPSRAYRGRRTNFIVQFTETAVINEKTINETRLQLIRNRFHQTSLEWVCAERARLVQGRRIAGWFFIRCAGPLGAAKLHFMVLRKSLREGWRATQAREDRQHLAAISVGLIRLLVDLVQAR